MTPNLKLIDPKGRSTGRTGKICVFDEIRREFPHRDPRQIAEAILSAKKFMRPQDGLDQLVYLARGAISSLYECRS